MTLLYFRPRNFSKSCCLMATMCPKGDSSWGKGLVFVQEMVVLLGRFIILTHVDANPLVFSLSSQESTQIESTQKGLPIGFPNLLPWRLQELGLKLVRGKLESSLSLEVPVFSFVSRYAKGENILEMEAPSNVVAWISFIFSTLRWWPQSTVGGWGM